LKKIVMMFSVMVLVVLTACGGSESASGENGEEKKLDKIVFADAGWDSIRVHNAIASNVFEHGYGYETSVTNGSSAATLTGLREGDINVYMEVWTDNMKKVYGEAIDSGDIKKLSTNFDDNKQGLWVPTYVIEGDEERGIEPMAPDLKTMKDLEKYKGVFQDPEDPSKGRIVGAPSGWLLSEYLDTKVDTYGLREEYNYFRPGSDSAIITSLAAAYEDGKPWVGYYWSPSWVTSMYDLTLLEEPEFEEDVWEKNKGTEFPPNDVVVAVHKDFPNKAPELTKFLEQYKTSSALTGETLVYMKENEATAEEAAVWWMNKHEDLWTKWLPEDVAKKVKEGIK